MSILSCAAVNRSMKFRMEKIYEFITRKTKNGTLAAGVLISIIIFGAGYLAWVHRSRSWRRRGSDPPHRHVLTRSLSVGMLHGGELAIQRLVDYQDARIDGPSWDGAENDLDALLAEEFPKFKKLQRTVTKLEMSGKEAEAVEKLEKAVSKGRNEGKPHEAYEFEMLLVEMLIYKGEFGRALQCHCLKDEKITDARRPLYKAIIHILLEHPKEEAKECWEDFKQIRRDILWLPASSAESSQVHEVVTDFTKFENVVKLLKNDIHDAQQKVAAK